MDVMKLKVSKRNLAASESDVIYDKIDAKITFLDLGSESPTLKHYWHCVLFREASQSPIEPTLDVQQCRILNEQSTPPLPGCRRKPFALVRIQNSSSI